MNKKKLYVAIIIIPIVYIIITQYYSSKSATAQYHKFNSSTVEGIIDSVYFKNKQIAFKLLNSDEEYVFFPYASEYTGGKTFDILAKRGSKVYKASFSDTLVLVADHNIYKFNFLKKDAD
ncbi:hypothetical protein [Flavobacterium subsaxonicum]|uniref:Uncharacterized protein n=1 Tax=Flavobacterium subsaxonicum WB 4.1-42 = DSM 21790 TaxID=1121898 RepID=A0A0A2MHL6_9FLAO|nr:hypothetical protein [Flavobacterium subsaxonicum]KGO90963.1 hypothetical protein Q766_20450 [Flavobacterium subsaxonicum WB 4.1-42 = DSM 21790]